MSGHFTFMLYQNVHCIAYLAGNALNGTENQTQPNLHHCYSHDVSTAVATSLDQQQTALAVLGAVVSGVYGVLLDTRSRKYVMAAGTVLRAIGDVWLFLCLRSSALTTSNAVLLTALFNGLAGGSYVVLTAQLAFLTDTSSPTRRTFVLGLALSVMPMGSIASTILSAAVTSLELYGAVFSIAMVVHLMYLAYLHYVLRELRKPSRLEANALEEKPPSVKEWILSGALFTPIVMIVSNPTLRWLSMMIPCLVFARKVAELEVTNQLSEMPIRYMATMVTTAMSSGLAALCLVPAFVMLYRKYAIREQRQSTNDSQDGPNLGDVELDNVPRDAGLDTAGSGQSRFDNKVAVRQELLLCRLCFFVQATSLVLLSLSRNKTFSSVAFAITALGSPVDASLFTLTTLAVAPGQIGSAIIGFRVIENMAGALCGSLLSAISKVTSERPSFVVCWPTAGVCVLCAIVIARLRPRMLREDDRH